MSLRFSLIVLSKYWRDTYTWVDNQLVSVHWTGFKFFRAVFLENHCLGKRNDYDRGRIMAAISTKLNSYCHLWSAKVPMNRPVSFVSRWIAYNKTLLITKRDVGRDQWLIHQKIAVFNINESFAGQFFPYRARLSVSPLWSTERFWTDDSWIEHYRFPHRKIQLYHFLYSLSTTEHYTDRYIMDDPRSTKTSRLK